MLPTDAQCSSRCPTKNINIPIPVDAKTPRTHNKHTSSNTSADRNYIRPPTWRNSCNLQQNALIDQNATGIVTSIFITSSLSTVNNNAEGYQLINSSDLPYTLPIDTHMAGFASSFTRTTQTHQTCRPINSHIHNASAFKKHRYIP